MTLVIPLGLAVLMLAVGLETSVADFRALARAPLGVALGLAVQVLGLPLAAAAIALGLGLAPAHAVGLVLVAASPGGVTANFVTLMARGDVALSVTLTVATSLAAPLTVPLVLGLAFTLFAGDAVALHLPFGPTVAAVFATTVVPLLIGLALRARHPAAVERLRPAMRRLSTVVFLVVVTVAVLSQWQALVLAWTGVGVAVVALNLTAMMLARGLGRTAGLPSPDLSALAISAGLRNIALALTVAIGLLGRPDIAVAATLHVFAMNASALAYVAWARRRRGGFA